MNFEFADKKRNNNKKNIYKIEILKQVSNVASCKNIQTSGPPRQPRQPRPGPYLDFWFQFRDASE